MLSKYYHKVQSYYAMLDAVPYDGKTGSIKFVFFFVSFRYDVTTIWVTLFRQNNLPSDLFVRCNVVAHEIVTKPRIAAISQTRWELQQMQKKQNQLERCAHDESWRVKQFTIHIRLLAFKCNHHAIKWQRTLEIRCVLCNFLLKLSWHDPAIIYDAL